MDFHIGKSMTEKTYLTGVTYIRGKRDWDKREDTWRKDQDKTFLVRQ